MLRKSPMFTEAARASADPGDTERTLIDLAVMDAKGDRALSGPGGEQQAAEKAISLVVSSFGIDLTHVKDQRIIYDPALPGEQDGETDGKDGTVKIGPAAFRSGGPGLAAAILHEVTHANQTKLRGDVDPPSQLVLAYEVMAYETAETNAAILRLTPEFLAQNAALQQEALNALHQTNRDKLLQDGRYWELDPDLESPDPGIFARLGSRPS
jgi:hypothetical protein